MKDSKLRAWWSHRQGLDGSVREKLPAQILERCGWSRSVGGVGPYLTLFSRGATSREAADTAASKREIHELPTARGCTYVIPASDFALGLTVGLDFGGDMKTALKLGVTEKEVDKLCDGVVMALANGPLDPDGIREATGKASRSLGDEGRKRGLTTTLPLALGRLQAEGRIRRVPVNGRFDQQRYKYVNWTPNRSRSTPRHLRGVHGARAPVLPLGRAGNVRRVPVVLRARREGNEAGGGAVRLVPAKPGSDRLLLPDDARSSRRSSRRPLRNIRS
jgi:hypothetical protein